MNASGRLGETYTANYLKKQGYQILDRNFRVRGGEIDMIACDAQYIVFVEVKTRAPDALADPAESLTPQQKKRILFAAQVYLQRNQSELQPRFDVACVSMEKQGLLKMVVSDFTYLKNAFWKETGWI